MLNRARECKSLLVALICLTVLGCQSRLPRPLRRDLPLQLAGKPAIQTKTRQSRTSLAAAANSSRNKQQPGVEKPQAPTDIVLTSYLVPTTDPTELHRASVIDNDAVETWFDSESAGQFPTEQLDEDSRYSNSNLNLPDLEFQSSAMQIDLPTTLQLAGANNWTVKLARERICQASAQYAQAKYAWLPNLSFGIGYNGHEGQLQSTEGNINQVSRHSVFLGGGASIADNSITGGAGGPMRLSANLSVADSIFEPLARCQLVKAEQAAADAVFNKTIGDAGLGYFELLRAAATLAAAHANLADTEKMAKTTDSFIQAGKGAEADRMRATVLLHQKQQAIIEAQGQQSIAIARLARLLNLDPHKVSHTSGLLVVDSTPVPVDLVPAGECLGDLLHQVHSCRPEIRSRIAQLKYSNCRLASEIWRPALPHLNVGTSYGGFGGGPGSQFPDFKDRVDLDVAIAWQLDNMGLGNKAMRCERVSQRRQAELALADIRDRVTAEVSENYYAVESLRTQIEIARQALNEAEKSLEMQLKRIRGLEGLPIELIQAVESVARSRETYLNTVIDYNQAQVKLLQAIGARG